MPTTAEVLAGGTIEVLGRMPWSSNATFLVEISLGDVQCRAVHKPERGERPLWDFPAGVYRRERAAFVLSEALGWDLVPLTILRADGPHGAGSMQLFIDADFEQHYFTIVEQPRHRDALARICAFDLVTNATDRKAGHVLVDEHDHIWAIDNGLTFSVDPKLRTVIWDFAGEAVPRAIVDDLCALTAGGLPDELDDLLSDDERSTLLERAEAVARTGRFPHDPTGRRVPWPLV